MTGKDNIQKIAFYQVIFPGNAGSLHIQRTSGIHLPPSTRVGAMLNMPSELFYWIRIIL